MPGEKSKKKRLTIKIKSSQIKKPYYLPKLLYHYTNKDDLNKINVIHKTVEKHTDDIES